MLITLPPVPTPLLNGSTRSDRSMTHWEPPPGAWNDPYGDPDRLPERKGRHAAEDDGSSTFDGFSVREKDRRAVTDTWGRLPNRPVSPSRPISPARPVSPPPPPAAP